MLSHMRSYSSLLGHILGSHPEIIGHRERHRSYENARQLLLFRYHMFVDNRRAGKGFVFDKLLHNHCRISDPILQRPDLRLFVVLRRPEPTMKSILHMGRKKGENSGFGDPKWVSQYYCERLRQIVDEVRRSPRPVGFLFAEDVVERTDEVLEAMRKWLGLSAPLQRDYQIFFDTGSRSRGDWSDRIRKGTVLPPDKNRYSDIVLPPLLLEQAQATYEACRRSLLGQEASEAGEQRVFQLCGGT